MRSLQGGPCGKETGSHWPQSTELCCAEMATVLPTEAGKQVLSNEFMDDSGCFQAECLKKKKVSVGHLFVNLAEDGKMQEKIDEPKKELCGFPAFRGDPEG